MSTSANLNAWNENAAYWDQTLGERGNDLFQQLILPNTQSLVGDLHPGDRVLDLGTGNGMIARDLARDGVYVLASDYSPAQLENAARRAVACGKRIETRVLDLMSEDELNRFAGEYSHDKRFDVVTGSMLLKELASIEPLAQFLPKILKPNGRAVFVNPHPCFHKPAGHRAMEVYEDPQSGEQKQLQYIKVMRYLKIAETQTQAIRGQPQSLTWFHRPIHELLNRFAKAGLVLDETREPSFDDELNPKEVQNYHNYPQIPMLFIFKLRMPPQAML